MPAGTSVVEGGTIPYQAWALAKRNEHFANRQTADPLSKCYMAGVPRIMYLNFPMQIFQNARRVSILFEWSQNYRQISPMAARDRRASSSGWAIRAAIGRATRLSSASRITTTRRGST